MIKPINGVLWQWDTGRYVTITPRNGGTVTEVDLFNGTTDNAIVAKLDGNKAKIPDVFLQSPANLLVYAVMSDADGRRTTESAVLAVNKRKRPDDYVYTEEDLKTWQNHERRIAFLEKGGVDDEKLAESIKKYLTENPPELDEEAVAEIVAQQTADKLDKSGHEPDMFLGTDSDGNVVTKKEFINWTEGGLYVDDGILWLDNEYVKEELVMPAVSAKQDAFEVGDGLKLVDGVLSLDLDTWQGGEY